MVVKQALFPATLVKLAAKRCYKLVCLATVLLLTVDSLVALDICKSSKVALTLLARSLSEMNLGLYITQFFRGNFEPLRKGLV